MSEEWGEIPDASLLSAMSIGSFDSAGTSLREVPAPLRMTNWIGLPVHPGLSRPAEFSTSSARLEPAHGRLGLAECLRKLFPRHGPLP